MYKQQHNKLCSKHHRNHEAVKHVKLKCLKHNDLFSVMTSSQYNYLLQTFLNNRRACNTKVDVLLNGLENRNSAEIFKTFGSVIGSFMANSQIASNEN